MKPQVDINAVKYFLKVVLMTVENWCDRFRHAHSYKQPLQPPQLLWPEITHFSKKTSHKIEKHS